MLPPICRGRNPFAPIAAKNDGSGRRRRGFPRRSQHGFRSWIARQYMARTIALTVRGAQSFFERRKSRPIEQPTGQFTFPIRVDVKGHNHSQFRFFTRLKVINVPVLIPGSVIQPLCSTGPSPLGSADVVKPTIVPMNSSPCSDRQGFAVSVPKNHAIKPGTWSE